MDLACQLANLFVFDTLAASAGDDHDGVVAVVGKTDGGDLSLDNKERAVADLVFTSSFGERLEQLFELGPECVAAELPIADRHVVTLAAVFGAEMDGVGGVSRFGQLCASQCAIEAGDAPDFI